MYGYPYVYKSPLPTYPTVELYQPYPYPPSQPSYALWDIGGMEGVKSTFGARDHDILDNLKGDTTVGQIDDFEITN